MGIVNVHLYRPFSVSHFINRLPETVKKIAVLDRTREPGAIGEPLFLDVQSAVTAAGRDIKVCGGRYGLGSKDVIPEDIMAVYEHLKAETPRHNFTVSIKDDVTGLSLTPVPVPEKKANLFPANSGGSAQTAPSAPTRAPLKSLATTRICTPRDTLLTIPRNPAA